MASEQYWKDKCATWKEIISCVVIWLLLVASLFITDVAVFDAPNIESAATPTDAKRLTEIRLHPR